MTFAPNATDLTKVTNKFFKNNNNYLEKPNRAIKQFNKRRRRKTQT